MHVLLYVNLFLQLAVATLAKTFPPLQLEILLPVGFRLAVSHQDGISGVKYLVNINKPLAANQLPDYYYYATEPVNGRWVFENATTMLYYSTKVNYWVKVEYGADFVEKSDETTVTGAFMELTNGLDASAGLQTLPSGCKKSVTIVRGQPVCQGELVFEDNFDTLDWSKWEREIRIPLDDDDAEFVSFQRNPENLYVKSGQLHIVPSLLSNTAEFNEEKVRNGLLDLTQYCTGIVDMSRECSRKGRFTQILPPVVSARIRTRHAFSFRYGRVEIRAKMPKGDWLFPLILLEPQENYYGFSGYSSGQMRVASIHGNEYLEDSRGDDISGKRLYGGVILETGADFRHAWLKSSTEESHMGNDFHNYTLIWADDSVTLQVDEKRYSVIQGYFSRRLRITKPYARHWENGNYMAPFDREFYLTLGVSVGGHSEFPDESRSGLDRDEKPWTNMDPKAALKFWNNRDRWYSTWRGENAGLHIDYIRVYAL